MISEIEKDLKNYINDKYKLDIEVELITPSNKNFGNLSTTIAFDIAKATKSNPNDIAEILKDYLESKFANYFKETKVVGGFLNITENTEFFKKLLLSLRIKKSIKYLYTEKKVSIEHTAANPNKALHIGHLRNFSIADTLVRLFTATDAKVTIQYFNNNQGLQVAKIIWGIKNLDKLGLKDYYENAEKNKEKFDSICSKIYVEAEKLSGDESIAKEITEILVDTEKGHNKNSDMLDDITAKILKAQLDTCFDFGVNYDEIITENAMTRSGEIERIIEELLKTGKVHKETTGKNEGCIVIKGIKDANGTDLPDKVLVRKNGTYVYTAKDIVLHLFKFGLLNVNFKFVDLNVNQPNGKPLMMTSSYNDKGDSIKESADLHINVVDSRQSFPLEVVKQSLFSLGFKDESNRLHHLAYEVVSLSNETAKKLGYILKDDESKSIAMSGRKGVEVRVDELLKLTTKEILDKSHSKTEKSEKLSESEAKAIAASALRYYMIKFGYNTEIVFDMDDALKSDGNTGIYLIYAYVRALKILEKHPMGIFDVSELDFDILSENEKSLMFETLRLISTKPRVYTKVLENYTVIELANYSYNLAKTFTDFYQNVQVLSEKNEDKKKIFLYFLDVFITDYKSNLEILGFSLPSRI